MSLDIILGSEYEFSLRRDPNRAKNCNDEHLYNRISAFYRIGLEVLITIAVNRDELSKRAFSSKGFDCRGNNLSISESKARSMADAERHWFDTKLKLLLILQSEVLT